MNKIIPLVGLMFATALTGYGTTVNSSVPVVQERPVTIQYHNGLTAQVARRIVPATTSEIRDLVAKHNPCASGTDIDNLAYASRVFMHDQRPGGVENRTYIPFTDKIPEQQITPGAYVSIPVSLSPSFQRTNTGCN